ncbi:MAG TPA: hypothetical protein VJ247_01095 [Gaiella sp.]|jgi:hypothetical protein|nr:hypothetical protein [Gaiella sp.]
MSTPNDILAAALAFSTKNRPEWITSKSGELVETVMRAMRGLYLFGASVNPSYFAEKADVAAAAGSWARPATANAVILIRNPAGQEVIVVPENQQDADRSRPALFQRGLQYFGAGGPLDPVAGALTFTYAKKATKPATADAAFDASWNTDFDGLLATETAIYLAIQDGRIDEASAYVGSRDAWAKQFAAWLDIETVPRVYAYRIGRGVSIPDLIRTTLASVPSTAAS